jgi:hypothetical protein
LYKFGVDDLERREVQQDACKKKYETCWFTNILEHDGEKNVRFHFCRFTAWEGEEVFVIFCCPLEARHYEQAQDPTPSPVEIDERLTGQIIPFFFLSFEDPLQLAFSIDLFTRFFFF